MSILASLQISPETTHLSTPSGIQVTRTITPVDGSASIDTLLQKIDKNKGAVFSSKMDFPGRYSRWDVGFVNPLLELKSFGKKFQLQALQNRGCVVLAAIANHLAEHELVSVDHKDSRSFSGTILSGQTEAFHEEERTLQPSIFSLIRTIKELFSTDTDPFLGLYGAFGYDLVFQFEPMELQHERDPELSDLILYFPDQLTIIDHQLSCSYRLSYDFSYGGRSTADIPHQEVFSEAAASSVSARDPYQKGRYAKLVETAVESFKVGDLFEVVPSHTFVRDCPGTPSALFTRLMEINPSPYGFFINLGSEYLVGSSPEMYVRVTGNKVETCPISGTIRRGADPIEDADRIKELLNSAKDESELTMCTDVDRNDKSRICIPGSVKVIGRRQIELYSHLIHTVDHIEGTLDPKFDALDAFMTHMWAVTVTGAPKRSAIKWIEQHEDSPRRWYGGAVGFYSFDGNLNTGLTLRTIRIKNGIAEIRVGATLLYDSIPEDEEEETLTKAGALFKALEPGGAAGVADRKQPKDAGEGLNILFVDHEDSFVHTLANYFKQFGAKVSILRSEFARERLRSDVDFDLVLLSPGPGRPGDFKLSETIQLCLEKNIPIFGVCLGLQGMIEYFGGTLDVLPYPYHGKVSVIDTAEQSFLWEGIAGPIAVGRYHSLHAQQVPDCFAVTAKTSDDVVMAIEHKSLPVWAVQFHPESIMSARNEAGMTMIRNVLNKIRQKSQP
ncbi:anthranilate synthase component I [Brevibacillus sp. B_LB10_24]|uniref:anthranilate synthase component I n=1 Tax=Brevibacillus sp. B_LB10_24 TaxID=3380645 RepID=UPI0038B6CE77